MISHPNCKINLGLRIIRKRPDGYHDLSSIFIPIPLCDELEIEPSQQFEFSQGGIPIDCPLDDNICVKAYRLLATDFPAVGAVRMHLEKRIPFGAGLGGGSSDAAFVLRMLNDMFSLELNSLQLRQYAVRLGADCAFFIDNQPALATGIGDILTPLGSNPLKGFQLVLAKPDEGVSTREAYGGLIIDPAAATSTPLPQLIQAPVADWRGTVVNDFERTVFPLHPAISQLKDECYRQGALFAAMSGSGATVFGLFAPDATPELPHTIFQGQL